MLCWITGSVAALLSFAAAAQPLDRAMLSVVSILPQWPRDATRLAEPEGSGVVMFEGRTIVTTLHVVDKALSIQVRTIAGDIFPARLTGRDRASDIATLAVDKPLPAIKLAPVESRLGDKVCAIGNAFGLGLSVSCGVVSGIHRAGMGFNRVEDFIQTDAAVNPGASGGALVNQRGEFTGMLSAIFTKRSDANIGVNFAVSAALTGAVARQLRDTGRVKRPISGLRLEPFPGKGETGRLGARVVSMKSGFLGERAGFKEGDIILRAAGRRVRKPVDFVSAMSSLLRTDALDIEIERNGAMKKLRIEK